MAKTNEPKTTKVIKRINDNTRLRFDRYFTPRPTPDTAEMIDSPMITNRPANRPTVLGAGTSPVVFMTHSMPVIA